MFLPCFTLSLSNIHFPCDNQFVNLVAEYQTILAELQTAIDSTGLDKVILMGDFNADPRRGRLWAALTDFFNDNTFTVHDLSLPCDSFTCLSPSHNTTSWLDHIVSNNCFSLQNISIDFNAVSFDHFPVSADFIIEGNINYVKAGDEFVDWQKFDRDAIEIYNFQCENNLQNVDICDVLGCNQLEHCQKIDDAFEIILQTFKSATQDYRHKKVIKFVPVPGWNEHCKDLHEKARQAFVAWCMCGNHEPQPQAFGCAGG